MKHESNYFLGIMHHSEQTLLSIGEAWTHKNDSYTEMTLLDGSQLTLDQVHGLTWLGFQSLSWLGEA